MTFPEDIALSNHNGCSGQARDDFGLRSPREKGSIKSTAASAISLAYRVLTRRKAAEEGVGRLARVLSAFDLTALGVGSTLGVGVYVLAGDVAKNYAGPAVIISFLLAALASMMAGLCYAEFGARVPKAGSAYVYSYVCVGEFVAFIIGWNLILEYVIGAASVVKALCEYLDSLAGGAISSHMIATVPMNMPHMARYPDVLAFSVIMLFSVALAFGVKESTKFNNFCTGVNLCVVLFVIISGCFKADLSNWRIPESQVPKSERDFGTGGFAPYGLAGIIKGAAVCFYGFIGFDCVATAGEEARRPQKTIPLAVVTSLLVVLLAYCGVSSVLTLMLPYYMQDEKSPFPHVYSLLGWAGARWAVSAGALCALCSSLLGAVFPLPRIIYAMSADGLLYGWLGRVSHTYNTPLAGTLAAGVLTGLLAMLCELQQLIHMMSIGTLLAYAMVAACVLILRYERSQSSHQQPEPLDLTLTSVCSQLLNLSGHVVPNRLSAACVTALVTLYGICCMITMYIITTYSDGIVALEFGPTAAAAAGSCITLFVLYAISRQPVSEKKLAFSTPLVPWLPGLSIAADLSLMLQLDAITWARFAVWIAVGLIIYLTYGLWHSAERKRSLDSIQLEQLHNDSQTALLQHNLTHTLG